MQCKAMQCNVFQCNVFQCNVFQCNVFQCNAVQCSAVQCSAMQCNAMQCNVMYVCRWLTTVVFCNLCVRRQKIQHMGIWVYLKTSNVRQGTPCKSPHPITAFSTWALRVVHWILAKESAFTSQGFSRHPRRTWWECMSNHL